MNASRFLDIFDCQRENYYTFVEEGKRERDSKTEGKYDRYEETVTVDVIEKHLNGIISVGLIPTRRDGTCSWGVIDGLTHRVGRYPTKRDGGASWSGIWMDTNPMDDDHWWFKLAEKEKMSGKFAWKFFKQEGGVVEADPAQLPDNPEANDHIFASGKWWKLNPKAENIKNLPSGYYQQMLLGKNLDWIRCYAGGKYTYVQEGKPVWQEYDDSMMSGEVDVDPTQAIQVGLDFGLTPAAVIGQRLANGRWNILDEIVTEDMGLERFGQQLLAELNAKYPNFQVLLWGDPAGMARDAIYEVTSFDYNSFRLDDATKGVLNNTTYGLGPQTGYADITEYVTEVAYKRGRRNIDNQFGAGTMSFRMTDETGILGPYDTASPYYDPSNDKPGLAPMRRVRLSRSSEYLFVGYVTAYNYEFALAGPNTVAVQCSDDFYLLAQKNLLQASTGTL